MAGLREDHASKIAAASELPQHNALVSKHAVDCCKLDITRGDHLVVAIFDRAA